MSKNHIFISITSICFLLFSCETQKETTESKTEESIEKASMAEIEEGIKQHIKATTELNDGYFPLKDDSLDLNMRLVRVHTEYLSNLGSGSYFACVDLAAESGDVYDVDFFLEGTPGSMKVVRKSIHKLNGKPFYTWKQNKEDKTWHKVAVEQAGNELLGVIEGTDEFEFYYTITLPEIEGEGKIWIPTATTDDFQTVEVLSIDTPTKEKYLKDDQFNNEVIYMELDKSHSGEKIAISYTVKRKEKGPYESNKDENLEQYLTENTLIPVNDKFKAIAEKAIGNKTKNDRLIQARALYDFIIDSMKYIKDGYYGEGDAVYACDAQSGNCSEFHSYFIALARSIGIPARFAIGAAIPSDRDEGGINGYHCWAEFYADGKWWPVDISEANKYTALATYYFGHHPANRVELSKGRDIEFYPGPALGAINFLAYPIMEINGLIVKPKTTFTFKRKVDA
jgi:transglutaminase-like putative cysteine protease